MRVLAFALALVASSVDAQGMGGPGLRKQGQAISGITPASAPNVVQATTAPLTFYVDNRGSDSNDCTSDFATGGTGGPCATPQGALNKSPKLLRHQVTVSIDGGTYPGFIVSGFSADMGVQQANGGLLVDGVLTNSTLATGSATGTAAGAGQLAGSGATFGVLCDSGATWTVNDLRGRFITTASPTNSTFVISSNTATCVTVVGTWSLPVAGSTTYTIQDPAVTINTAVTQPPTPAAGALANVAGIGFFGSSLNYRNVIAVVRNLKVANGTGGAVRIEGGGSIQFTQTQLAPSATNPTAVTIGTNTSNIAPGHLTFTKVYVTKLNDNPAVQVNGSATFSSSNSLFFNGNNAGDLPAVQVTDGRIGSFLSNELNGWSDLFGVYVNGSNGVGNGVVIQGTRFVCRSHAGSTGLKIGVTTNGGTTGLGGAAVMSISTSDFSTCENAVQALGPVGVDVATLSGSVSVTGIAAFLGALVVFTKTGMTLTSATNELNLDTGGVTAAFADVAAGSCLSSGAYGSKVCGR